MFPQQNLEKKDNKLLTWCRLGVCTFVTKLTVVDAILNTCLPQLTTIRCQTGIRCTATLIPGRSVQREMRVTRPIPISRIAYTISHIHHIGADGVRQNRQTLIFHQRHPRLSIPFPIISLFFSPSLMAGPAIQTGSATHTHMRGGL